jgi:cytochrome oxidase Cu insertion factor (SCO1/SenC/PrrC family)
MKRLTTVIFLLIVLLLWKTPVVNAQTQFVEAGVEKFRVPVEAPDFILKEVGGGKVSLKELRGKIILLNFFASW